MSTDCLYRRLSDEAFVRYDPHADRFSVVPAASVPVLVRAIPERVRLSEAAAEKGNGGRFRRAVLLAMLDFQHRAHKAGYPQAATPYLKALADLAADPEGPAKLRMSWAGQQTRRNTVKAVGTGADAGRTLYGKRAIAALKAQDARGGRSGREHREHRRQSAERAGQILTDVHTKGVTAEHLGELAGHLPHLPLAQLRRARVLLGASFGGARQRQAMVDAVTAHVRKVVDRLPGGGKDWVGPLENVPEPQAKPAPKKPKKRAGKAKDTVLNAVIRYGGIDPKSHSLLTHVSGVSEARENGIPLSVFKGGGRGLDQLAQELQSAGVIHVPDGKDPGEYLLDQIRTRAHTQGADQTAQHERDLDAYYRAREEAERETDPAEVAEVVRRGEEAGRLEGEGDLLGGDGEGAGQGGGEGDGGEYDNLDDSDLPDGVDTSFDFGENAAEPEPARPAYTPPSDAGAVASELVATYKALPGRKPDDPNPPIPGREKVADLIDRAGQISKPLAQGISSFLKGGERYSYRMFHVARELLERHEREAAGGKVAEQPKAEDATEPEPESAPAAEPAAPADPLSHADADHTPALDAIPKGGNAYVAGHFVRRLADGGFQVEVGPGKYKKLGPWEANEHIRRAWRNQGVERTKIADALKRADADAVGGDPFGVSDAEREGRAAVPEGTRAVSLDPNTRGRTGTVKRDEDGAAHLALDGGAEAKATDFEPLNDKHSWRAPGKRSVQPDLFGADEAKPTTTAPTGGAVPSSGMGTEKQPDAPKPAAPSLKPGMQGLSDEQFAEGLKRAEETSAKAVGAAPPAEPARPRPDQEAARVKAALSDPSEWDRLAADAAFPEVDRNKLLAAVREHFGDDLHEQAKKKSKGGILELVRKAKPKGAS